MTAFQFPYQVNSKYSTKVAYFSMEFAIHQPLKIYSGGLGFLAGSHMRSAYDLKQSVVGLGILWKYGYYDQSRNEDGSLGITFRQKSYNFLEDTGIKVKMMAFEKEITIKAWLLKPEVFGSAPIYLLSTDTEENDYPSNTITHKLYDDNKMTRILQYMVLGIGGAKVLEALGYEPDIYHMNEAHPLPVAFHLLGKYKKLEEVKKRLVFTTHTPEEAGNEKSDLGLIQQSGFLNGVDLRDVQELVKSKGYEFNHSLVALRMAKISNGVSKIHGKVSNEMWKDYEGICPITSITNAQNKKYWVDPILEDCLLRNDDEGLKRRKRELKVRLFEEVADQTGKILDPDVLTIVWARRFAGYKRADFMLHRMLRFLELVNRAEMPIQVIWAGKPYPLDKEAIHVFNDIFNGTKHIKTATILIGYELGLSRLLKQGSDVWLNNPRFTREASGTSGMTAAMNASINFSIRDGWVDEFARHNVNSFVIPHADPTLDIKIQDEQDLDNLYRVLEEDVIPTYYQHPDKWMKILKQSMKDVAPMFDSDRMADEYYRLIYNSK